MGKHKVKSRMEQTLELWQGSWHQPQGDGQVQGKKGGLIMYPKPRTLTLGFHICDFTLFSSQGL